MVWSARASHSRGKAAAAAAATTAVIVNRRGLAQLTKWCTLFIILDSTSVGSGLITSSTVGAWLESELPSSPSTVASHLATVTTVPSEQPEAPRFEALVQDSPFSATGSRGKTLPLLGSGALKETAAPAVGQDGPMGNALARIGTSSNNTSGAIKSASLNGSSSRRSSNRISNDTSISTGAGDRLALLRKLPELNETTSTIKPTASVNPGIDETSHSSESNRYSKLRSENLIGLVLPKTGLSNRQQPLPSPGSGGGNGTLKPTTARAATFVDQDPSSHVNRLGEDDNGLLTEGNFSKMYFVTNNHTVIASQVGSIAVLPCGVRNIGEGVVSWIRRKDYHLLTIGVTTYSSDERFNIIHSEDTEEWPLQIKYVQLRDAGPYECQVSTHPPTSIFVQLEVVEAKAEISGHSEKYLKPGSMLRLTCRILQSNEPALYLFWYHNNRMINYDTHRGVNVSTEPDNRYSELFIAHTNTLHSGNYSCVSNNAVAASTLVHILNGENPAAMQHNDHGNAVLVVSHIHLPLTIVTYQAINFILNMH
ncbi:uncharacterized protein LOC131207867 [Anopheles bellator]|uniref:uncharacterized protein LOC131207867 n=1 Tax=Anopheles bellator TaxID=139047 RepID=UPI00264A20E1|nr:uncharacterized protein LOC131207867 [Anopheles bellator]